MTNSSAEFQSRQVERAIDGKRLKYYGGHFDGRTNTGHSELFGFLLSGYGQCQCWAALMAHSLAVHGIPSSSELFSYGVKYRIDLRGWRFIDGTKFILTGSDGICQTVAAGDDGQEIPKDQGLPDAICAIAPTTPQTIQFIAPGFALPYQRAFAVEDPKAVNVSGDDVIQYFANAHYILNGADGILQTLSQPGLKPVKNIADRYPSTARIMRFSAVEPQGDDRIQDNALLISGKDGICETQVSGGRGLIYPGAGLPNCVAISPGKNGVLDTKPLGDDAVVDISPWLKFAPQRFSYLPGLNAIPPLEIPAQSSNYSPPSFPNHTILRVDGQLYDPSYGTGPFPDGSAFEKASLCAMSTGLRDADGEFIGIDDIPALQTNWWQFFQVRGSVVHAIRKLEP